MIHLVIGGSGSGKSEYAENLLEDSPGKYYIATMQVYDAEGERKVAYDMFGAHTDHSPSRMSQTE